MNKQKWIAKLTSRKFILSALAALTGILSLVFGENETIKTIMGSLMVILPATVYCIMEGKIDATNIGILSGAVTDTVQKLGADENTVKQLEQIGSAACSMAQTLEESKT